VRPVTVRLGAGLAVATVVLHMAAWASAAEPDARLRAQELLEQGNHLFRDGDTSAALELYRNAYGAFASPKLFFNIARCEESLGQRLEAMRDFARFLAEATDATPDVRAEAEQHTRALAPFLTAVDIAGPTNALVQLDGARIGVTPLRIPLWIEPGVHRLAVEQAGKPAWITTVVGRPGTRVAISVPEDRAIAPVRHDVVPPASIANKEPTGRGLLHRWWFWTGVGVVLLAGAVGTILVVRRCPATNGCE
jgi:hypothetical protein